MRRPLEPETDRSPLETKTASHLRPVIPSGDLTSLTNNKHRQQTLTRQTDMQAGRQTDRQTGIPLYLAQVGCLLIQRVGAPQHAGKKRPRLNKEHIVYTF